MRKFLFLLFLIIAAGCTSPTEDYDWCKIYDFTVDDYGFNFDAGLQVDDIGIYSAGGLIQFSYEYTQFVTPTVILVTVDRPDGIVGTININAAGTIYGVSASLSASMDTDEETVHFRPATYGDAGKVINVTLDVHLQDIIISSIEIRGLGATPFDTNPCDRVTPTETHTITPDPLTPTVTPSQTSTPTETLTPSDTPEANWSCQFDFSISDAGWTNYYTGLESSGTNGTYSSPTWNASDTVYSSGTIFRRRLYIQKSFTSATVTNIQMNWNITKGTFISGDAENTYSMFVDGSLYANGLPSSTTNGSNKTANSGAILVTGATSIEIMAQSSVRTDGGYNGTASVNSLNISGLGTNPFGAECNSLFTATPTLSPTPTRTTFPTTTPQNGGTATRTAIAYYSPTTPPTVDLTTTPATATGTPSVTNTAYPTYTYIPSYTPPSTYTAFPGTATSESDFDYNRENEAEWAIFGQNADFFSWLQNMLANLFGFLAGVFNAIINAIAGFFQLIADVINFLWNLLNAIISFILEILGIILLIINLILGLVGLLLAWIGQAIARLTALITAFFTAPATPINGLPLCVSDPLSYDICAIYYIMDWTIFQPGTPGSYIIPLVLTIMNVIIIFRFVRYVMKLVRKGEDVTR